MLIPFPGTCWQPPEKSRVLVNAFVRALERAGIQPKAAARLQGLKETQWSRQVQARDGAHVSLYRVGWLVVQEPRVLSFWIDEMTELVKAKLITDAAFRELIDKVQVLILALEPGAKTMAKAHLDLETAPTDTVEQDRRIS